MKMPSKEQFYVQLFIWFVKHWTNISLHYIWDMNLQYLSVEKKKKKKVIFVNE